MFSLQDWDRCPQCPGTFCRWREPSPVSFGVLRSRRRQSGVAWISSAHRSPHARTWSRPGPRTASTCPHPKTEEKTEKKN